MALLQVHQAKALKELQEGGHDMAVFTDLHAATDLVLSATQTTAQDVGHAMSTLVVQERPLAVPDGHVGCRQIPAPKCSGFPGRPVRQGCRGLRTAVYGHPEAD